MSAENDSVPYPTGSVIPVTPGKDTSGASAIDTNSGEAAQQAKGFRVREIAETKNWLTAD